MRERQIDFARNGVPFDLFLCRQLGKTPAELRGLSNVDYLELVAMFQLEAERARHQAVHSANALGGL